MFFVSFGVHTCFIALHKIAYCCWSKHFKFNKINELSLIFSPFFLSFSFFNSNIWTTCTCKHTHTHFWWKYAAEKRRKYHLEVDLNVNYKPIKYEQLTIHDVLKKRTSRLYSNKENLNDEIILIEMWLKYHWFKTK